MVVPGLPTTIFLIAASWLFARSCPWLEERLIRVPLFRPFLGYLDRREPMPRRAVVSTLVVMWLAITVSVALVALGENPRLGLAAIIAGLGVVGTVFVVKLGRRRTTQPVPGFVPVCADDGGAATEVDRPVAPRETSSGRPAS